MDMEFFAELEGRQIIKQVTDPALKDYLAAESRTLYCGFDPTSDSLHVGSLLPLLTLKRFQMAGHKPIAVVGGATGMIGDPSFKSQERSLLMPEQIERNVKGIREVISRFLEFGGRNAAKLVNNGDWFQGICYIDFLRDVGKHFTINHMIAKESVRARLEDRDHGISYTEFSYMLLQAYDFYHLNKELGCTIQVGGSDQWGNITAGCELIRRMHAHDSGPDSPAPHVFGLTHPLVMKADGTKFGKTEKGTVWLDAKKTSPYQFYQFFIQTADADVGTYLRYFTFLSLEEITALDESVKSRPEKREAQTALARAVTKLVHGESEMERVEKASHALFSGDLRALDKTTLHEVFAEAPTTKRFKLALSSGVALVDLLAETGLASSKGAARKDIQSGGISVNDAKVTDPAAILKADALLFGEAIVLRKGKKNYHLVVFE